MKPSDEFDKIWLDFKTPELWIFINSLLLLYFVKTIWLQLLNKMISDISQIQSQNFYRESLQFDKTHTYKKRRIDTIHLPRTLITYKKAWKSKVIWEMKTSIITKMRYGFSHFSKGAFHTFLKYVALLIWWNFCFLKELSLNHINVMVLDNKLRMVFFKIATKNCKASLNKCQVEFKKLTM